MALQEQNHSQSVCSGLRGAGGGGEGLCVRGLLVCELTRCRRPRSQGSAQ